MKACALLLALYAALVQQVTGQDLDTVLERADKLLEQAKAAYEEAREKSVVASFVDAGFKLEDARIKYIVLQEIGNPDKQKIAAERLRSVNQLAKLIHDGKVAISGASAEPKPAEPPPPTPGEPAKPLPAPAKVDISKRSPVPDAAKLKDAEKLIKDLYKEQYAKKTQADRKALARQLLLEAPKNRNDQMVFWVLCREAQDQAVQGCDLPTAMKAIDTAGEVFDIDGMALRNAALAATSKTAKTPEESAGVVAESFKSIDELVANDQYDAADKLAQAMMPLSKKAGNVLLFTQMSARAKDVADARGLYQGMKGVLETLAKTPDDPPANTEMGKFLCFVKGNWDLGLRFITKGPEGPLKTLGDKEMANPESAQERAGIADGWAELADKEKSGLRRNQLLNHALAIYDTALGSSTGLMRTKIEKQMTEIAAKLGPAAAGGRTAINLLALIDPDKDSQNLKWQLKDGALISPAQTTAKLIIPYLPPEEYDLALTVRRDEGNNFFKIGFISGDARFRMVFDSLQPKGLPMTAMPGYVESDKRGQRLLQGKTLNIVCYVRKDAFSVSVDNSTILDWKGVIDRPYGVEPADPAGLWLASCESSIHISRLTLTPVRGTGKRTRP